MKVTEQQQKNKDIISDGTFFVSINTTESLITSAARYRVIPVVCYK